LEETISESDRGRNATTFSTSDNDGGAQRPIMHTFYEPDPKGYCCGMLEDGHQRLLKAWEESWSAAGWDTQILTLKDARKHEDFDAVQKRLSILNLSEYDQKCYWRWLAMAFIKGGGGAHNGDLGGGWMSDYDTFPLELTGDEGKRLADVSSGKFTTFSMHVPCLIYASRENWDRILHLMVSVLPDRQDATATDMRSLLKVAQEFGDSAGMLWYDQTVKTFPYTKTKKDDEDAGERLPYRRHVEYEDVDGERLVVDCNTCKGMKAVHLSHRGTMDAVQSGLYPAIDRHLGVMNGRGEAGRIFMNDYREQCLQ